MDENVRQSYYMHEDWLLIKMYYLRTFVPNINPEKRYDIGQSQNRRKVLHET